MFKGVKLKKICISLSKPKYNFRGRQYSFIDYSQLFGIMLVQQHKQKKRVRSSGSKVPGLKPIMEFGKSRKRRSNRG